MLEANDTKGDHVAILLMILSILAVLILFGALVFYLRRIIGALRSIGGEPIGYSSRASYLGKIAFGVRAIEQQTGHLGPEVVRLNESLTKAAEGLRSIDGHLVRTIEAVVRQEGA
jgi:uncharacterized RDD family membrane protein YckC